MPRRRAILLGVLIALVSIAATALVLVLVVFPRISGTRNGEANRGGTGQAREVIFDPNDRLQVVVALQKLPRGFTIPADAYNNAVGIREWPAASVPIDAIVVDKGQDAQRIIEQQVVGKIARTDIEREEPLLRANLVDNATQLAQTGSDVAAQLGANMRAFAIPVDKLGSVGYSVAAGDRVDVVLSFEVLDVDQDFQSALPNWVYEAQYGTFSDTGSRVTTSVTPQEGAALGRIDTIPPGELANLVPSEPQRPRLVTQRTVVCAPVMLVGEAPMDGQILGVDQSGDRGGLSSGSSGFVSTPESSARPENSTRPDVVVLAVSPQEVNVLQWAVTSHIGISLSLCSIQEGAAAATSAVTLQYMFETYNVPVPPRLPYSLEPTLRGAPVPTTVAPSH